MREAVSFRMCLSLFQRLRGLMFCQPHNETILLAPCCDIHTFGMRHNIDVAFVDVQGVVVEVYQEVSPRRRLSNSGAVATLERFSNRGVSWVQKGDVIQVWKGSLQ